MEEYIRLDEEKAHRHGKVYNWETAKYGKIWYDEHVHDLRFVETEFPAIVFNDSLTSEETPSCEPTVSSFNDNEIDFRISFDESDDEDYIVIYDKNSFSYKVIFVNDLKKDSKNDNDKINMPLFPLPEPMVSYFDDLDFFKDFVKEFSAIVYNDALMSKSDFLTEPTVSPQHIDEFNLKNETSLFECDEEEQNVLYFNNLFPFKVIYPDDSKSDKDNDDDKIDIEHSSRDLSIKPLPNVKVNLTTPTLTFFGIEAYEPYSIVDKPNTGLIYLNIKDEKRVMYLVEIMKFCDATLEKVLKEVKLKIFQSEPWKKSHLLGHREQMRRWEYFVNGRPILLTMKRL
nr:hypothetical protein [Tanacetum cinerariifolium]